MQWWLVMSRPLFETKLPEQPGSCTALASRPVPVFSSHSLPSGSAKPCCLTHAGPSCCTCCGVHFPSPANATDAIDSTHAQMNRMVAR